METISIQGDKQLADFINMQGAPPVSPEAPSLRQADEHLLSLDDDGRAAARCSLWYTLTPVYPGHTVGLVGHYAAHNDEAAATLLNDAAATLHSHGCTLAIGPMDGSTFRHYRFVTNRAVDDIERPPFFLEPENPDAWPRQFKNAGFEPLAHYISAYGDMPATDTRLVELTSRANSSGITIRNADLDNFTVELERIYEIVAASFQDNFLYTPIAREEFVNQYAPIQPLIRPEHVLIAEQASTPVGFIFGIPDLAQKQRGLSVDTLILKTIAVRPEVGGHGLGSLLVASIQTTASAMGFRFVIHALLHETNVSNVISKHYATPIRRYTLFAKTLDA